jgi:hypothetical protein
MSPPTPSTQLASQRCALILLHHQILIPPRQLAWTFDEPGNVVMDGKVVIDENDDSSTLYILLLVRNAAKGTQSQRLYTLNYLSDIPDSPLVYVAAVTLQAPSPTFALVSFEWDIVSGRIVAWATLDNRQFLITVNSTTGEWLSLGGDDFGHNITQYDSTASPLTYFQAVVETHPAPAAIRIIGADMQLGTFRASMRVDMSLQCIAALPDEQQQPHRPSR